MYIIPPLYYPIYLIESSRMLFSFAPNRKRLKALVIRLVGRKGLRKASAAFSVNNLVVNSFSCFTARKSPAKV